MILVDNLKMMYCLNDTGLDKAHEFLKGILKNKEYAQISLEQLEKEMKESSGQRSVQWRKEEEEEKLKRDKRIKELKEQYKREFRMMDRCITPWMDNIDILKAIDETSNTAIMKINKSFEWGYIQGKRAERARRKMVNNIKDGSNIPIATLKQIIINRIKAINDLRTLQDVYSPLVAKDTSSQVVGKDKRIS